MGDGLLGTYGVHALLADPALRAGVRCGRARAPRTRSAPGAACSLLAERYGLGVDVVSGRVTDTPVGMRFCSEELGVPAWNALRDGRELGAAVVASLGQALPARARRGPSRPPR